MNVFLTGIMSLLISISSAADCAEADIEAGKAKADKSCARCHGANGEGSGKNPAIAGLDAEEHVSMLKAYKNGERGGAMMRMLSGKLSEQEMLDLAAYYASLGQ
ncbi:MAG: cytochrome c [Xanthomonadales bacterium]|nr:cytochrome c [Xanthomonadales bacterium]